MLGYFWKLINSERTCNIKEINKTSPQLLYDLLKIEQNTLTSPNKEHSQVQCVSP